MSSGNASGHSHDELENRFTYHAPQGDQVERYQALRTAGLELAELVDNSVPDSREKSLAFTAIEQAVMWANAGIARHEQVLMRDEDLRIDIYRTGINDLGYDVSVRVTHLPSGHAATGTARTQLEAKKLAVTELAGKVYECGGM